MKKWILSFVVLFSPLFASAHNLDGLFHISGADCSMYKGVSKITSLVARVDGDHARISFYNGARHPIDYKVGLLATGTATVYRLTGFPQDSMETVVLGMDDVLTKAAGLPRLVLTGKFKNPGEMPTDAFLSNPFTEDEDVQYRCVMDYEQTNDHMDEINPAHLWPTDHASMCSIEYRDIPRVNNWTHGCTASVVGDRKMLTAGHCQESFAKTELRIFCNGDRTTYYSVKKWDLNPAYRPKEHPVSNPHDISMITLDETTGLPVLAVEPDNAKISRLILENKNCRHYGMGTRLDGTVGKLYISPYAFPDEPLGGKAFVETIFEMTGMIASNPARFMRSGDSGGPIVCEDNGRDVIVGVHSFISVPSSSAMSGMTGSSYDFIQKQLAE